MQLLKRISIILLAFAMFVGFVPSAYAIEEESVVVVETQNEEESVITDEPQDEDDILVSELTLNAHSITWPVGKAGHFKPVVAPADATNKTLKWSSSDPSVATVSDAGKLTAVSVGTAKITCETTDGSELVDYCNVKIISADVKVTSLTLNAHSITWPVGKAGHFKPVVAPSNATNKTLKWTSSNPAVATVSSAGKLTAVSVGTAEIFCETTDGSGLVDFCDVKVTGTTVKATSLKLNASKITWPIGKSGHFKPTVSPDNTTNKKLSWTSSVKRVATVDENGKLTALAEGTTTITCKTTDGSNLKATCIVTVTDGTVKVSSLKLNATKITWDVGKSGHFKPTVAPSNATNPTLKWTSSNPDVATVSSAGKLTAVSAGTTTITCQTTDGSNLKATCAVTVKFVKATGLKLNATRINWIVGKAGHFKPTITPSNASVKQLDWHSSNLKVATVSQNGLLTAVFPGTATITCKTTDGSNLSATCKVTVYDPNNTPVTGINLGSDTISVAIGTSKTISPEITPADATNKSLTWHSSDEDIAKVDNGKVTAKEEGIAIITCKTTDGSDIMKTCKVFVYNPLGIKATDIELDADLLNWKVGQTGELTATVSPALATNKNLDWSSSNTDVVIIDDNGLIKAIKEGVSIITVRTVDGSELNATCKVVVGPADITAEDYDGSGLLGFAWDPEQQCFFSSKNSWQRNFGFCDVYDVAAPLTVMYYDTVRVKFRYDDRDWMIQMWKGQYGIFLGCEIGVYYKDIDSKIEFYDCVADEDLLYMDATLYRHGEKLFSRKYDKYWWITGFKLGALENIKDRSELTMNSTVTFHTKEMMDAFLVAFEEKGFYEGEHYWVSGKSVTFTWHLQQDPRNEG